MSPKEITKQCDCYIRVSKVGGREGESFISPADQEQKCRQIAAARGITVGNVYKDLDVSGGTVERPAFEEALVRIEDGVSGGMIVARLDRFARTLIGALQTLERINNAGGVLITVDGEFDTSTATGELALNVMLSFGQFELRRIKDGWSTTHDSMVERSITGGRTPSGYSRGKDKKLEPNEYAPAITEAFRLKAEGGSSWNDIARHLTEAGVPTQKGSAWTATAARKLIGNRTYLGDIHFGDRSKVGAHPALVDERLFRLANVKGDKVGSERGDGPLLGGGMCRCAKCGAGMVVSTTKTKNGSTYEYLRCQTAGKGHASIGVGIVEPYLVAHAVEKANAGMSGWDDEWVSAEVDPEVLASLNNAHEEIQELARMLKDGRITPTGYAAAEAKAQADRATLQAQVDGVDGTGRVRLMNRRVEADKATVAAMVAGPVPAETIPAARSLMKELLGKVIISPGRGPVEDRVEFQA